MENKFKMCCPVFNFRWSVSTYTLQKDHLSSATAAPGKGTDQGRIANNTRNI